MIQRQKITLREKEQPVKIEKSLIQKKCFEGKEYKNMTAA
jgi:hypothetical protein